MMVYPPPARLVLRANGLLSMIAGVALLLTGPSLAKAAGLDDPDLLAAVGGLLVAFGAVSGLVSASRGLSRRRVLPFALADLGWVAASIAVLVLVPHELTSLGRALVGASAAVVAWFAMAQLRAARKL